MAPFVLTGDPRTLALEEPYAGAEVNVLTDVPLGVSLGIRQLMGRFADAESGSEAEALALRAAWLLFADCVLDGWNLVDRRGRVPADPSSFNRVSPRFAAYVLNLWAGLMTPADEAPNDE